jgi:threonylcarbamoyladenosine tRNA methylthiotransferase MtaB
LAQIAQEISILVKRKYLNKKIEVLVEHNKDGFWTGFTNNYLRVYLKSTRLLENQLILVRLIKLWQDGFYGKIVNNYED